MSAGAGTDLGRTGWEEKSRTEMPTVLIADEGGSDLEPAVHAGVMLTLTCGIFANLSPLAE